MHSGPFPQYLATPWLTITHKSSTDQRSPGISKGLQVKHRHSVRVQFSEPRRSEMLEAAQRRGQTRHLVTLFPWPLAGLIGERRCREGIQPPIRPLSREPGPPKAAARLRGSAAPRLRPFSVRSTRGEVILRLHIAERALSAHPEPPGLGPARVSRALLNWRSGTCTRRPAGRAWVPSALLPPHSPRPCPARASASPRDPRVQPRVLRALVSTGW